MVSNCRREQELSVLAKSTLVLILLLLPTIIPIPVIFSQSRVLHFEAMITTGNDSEKEKETEESLPQGWTKQFAPDGRVYFVDHLNKKVGGIVPYEYLKKHLPDDMGGPQQKWSHVSLSS